MMHDMATTNSQLWPRRAPQASYVDVAEATLTEAIFDRKVEPGARLSIDGTARMLEMSITPIREAMTRLATQGLLIQDVNRGFSVAPLLTAIEFSSLFTTRRILESAVLDEDSADFGISTRLRNRDLVSQGQIQAIRKVGERMRGIEHGSRYRQFSNFSRLDSEFHREVMKLSGNGFLVNAWCGMNFHMHVSRLYSGQGVIDYSDALREHEAIVKAIEARDAKRLSSAVKRHVLAAEKRLVQLLPIEHDRKAAGL